jgi:hypothetical protein
MRADSGAGAAAAEAWTGGGRAVFPLKLPGPGLLVSSSSRSSGIGPISVAQRPDEWSSIHPMRGSLLLLLVLFLFFAACAKAAPPPTPPEPTASLPDASPSSTTSPEASVASAEDAAAPAPLPSPTPSASAVPEPVTDECAPVAMAFEQSLRPKLKKCWLDAANKKPNEKIIGSIKFVVEIDGAGKIASARQVDKSELPAPVVQCMNKAFKAEKIDTGKCTFKTLTVVEKFPR